MNNKLIYHASLDNNEINNEIKNNYIKYINYIDEYKQYFNNINDNNNILALFQEYTNNIKLSEKEELLILSFLIKIKLTALNENI